MKNGNMVCLKKNTIKVVIILLIFGVIISGCIKQPKLNEFEQRSSEFKMQYDEKKAQGYNVTGAENLAREAKKAFNESDYTKANEFLDEAFKALEKAKITAATPYTSLGIAKQDARKRLSQVKVASLYESITDGVQINRSMNDTVKLFKETHTDFIFRGFWRWIPVPESTDSISPELLQFIAENAKLNPDQVPEMMRKSGRSYKQLTESISAIKKEMPDIIIVGAIPAQHISRIDRNDINGKIYSAEDIQKVALDTKKWGLDNEQVQQRLQKTFNLKEAFFPDITNPDFQELLLSWAKKQVDSGADAIWIDGLFSQARALERISGDANHPAVKESYEAASKIVDEIHAYGYIKYNEYIYVGTWWTFVELPYSPPDVDFVTVSPSSKEITEKSLDESRWNDIMNQIKVKIGDIPIFAFIDWGGSESQTAIFSQKLNEEEQREMLKKMDAFFQKKGIIFVYPVHGGFMGGEAERLSFGKFKIYDSIAPEFDAYETIKEFAQNKFNK